MAHLASILVIDGIESRRQFLEQTLQQIGYNIYCTNTGEAGISIAERNAIDLIFLHSQPADMDGYSCSQKIKSHHLLSGIPIIFMLNPDEAYAIQNVIDAGGSDCLVNPYDVNEIKYRLSLHLEIRDIWRELAHQCEVSARSEDRYRQLVEESPDGILIVSQGKVVYANHTACILYRANKISELIGKPIVLLVAPESISIAQQAMQVIFQGKSATYRQNEKAKRLDDTVFDVEVTRQPHWYAGEKTIQIIIRDTTDRTQLQHQLIYQATHDTLTNLPNRTLLMDRLRQAIIHLGRKNLSFSVCVIDLDGFKWINSAYGHHTGDLLLREIAASLKKAVRDSDTIARLGTDQFALIIGLENPNSEHAIAHRLQAQINKDYCIDGRVLNCTACLGFSQYPQDAEMGEELLHLAESAMYQSKVKGPNTYCHFNTETHEQNVQRNSLEKDLQEAVGNQEFVLYYQPQVVSRTGEIIGAEALIRWSHPSLGLIAPDRFISIAEQSNTIMSITAWVVDEACRTLKSWHEKYQKKITMAVNISPYTLRQAENLEQIIIDSLERYSLPAEYLELEITESFSLEKNSQIVPLLRRLKSIGVKIAIDDFGTGYSNMSHLKKFPIDKIKIDGSFVTEISHDPRNMAIIDSIVSMSKQLKIEIIAERTETFGQVRLLELHGCNTVQGYFFSRPVTSEEFSALLKAQYINKEEIALFKDDTSHTLIVHYSKTQQQALKRSLANITQDILIADTAHSALDMMATHKIGMVLIAQNLVDTDLLDFLNRIWHLHPETYRVVIAENAESDVLKIAEEEGSAHFIIKELPVTTAREIQSMYAHLQPDKRRVS